MASVYCFSGTGNSLFAANQIAEKIGANVLSMLGDTKVCNDDVVGFVFPAYFWGLPKTVERFVSELEIASENPYIFAVVTYGGTIHGVVGVLEQLLRQKGLKIVYGNTLKSVENYIPSYKINDTIETRTKYAEKLKSITEDISKGAHKKFSRQTILNKAIHSLFPARNGDCDKLFIVSESCVGCGQCRDICPANNVKIEQGRPVFLHRCEHCISCVHVCSASALDWKGGMAKHGRYRHPDVRVSDLIAMSGTTH